MRLAIPPMTRWCCLMRDILSDNPADYCFIDTETKALRRTAGTIDADVGECGARRYSRNAKVIMVQYAIGNSPQRTLAFKDFDPTRTFIWSRSLMPDDLLDFYERAQRGEAWFVAWNSLFDRLMLSTIPNCEIRVDMMIDAMAQAAASNLPGKLEGASRAIGRHGKQQDGKALIKLFTGPYWEGDPEAATPQTHPTEWERFCTYGGQDIDELRAVFQATRPLPRREWEEFWVSERINDRGMMADLDFCERAAAIAVLNARVLNARITQLTGGAITKVTQRERIANWLYDHCKLSEARDTLVKTWVEDDEVTGDERELVPGKLSVAEDKLKAYVNYFEHLDETVGLTDDEYELLQIAEARMTGASATPAKFQKVLDRVDIDDRLKDQFRFNGAGQTGRFSSQDVQLHNLIRASLTDKEHPGRELAAIELINTLEVD